MERPEAASKSFRLADWVCEPRAYRVSGRGRSTQVEPKLMQVLECLAAHPGQVVTRRHLLDTVWSDAVVTEQVLSRAISELRKVFEDDSRTPRVIETIAKSGYRLLPLIEPLEPEPETGAPRTVARTSGPLPPPVESSGATWKRWALFALGIALGAALVGSMWRGVSRQGIQADPAREATGAALPHMRLSVLLPAEAPPELSWFRCFDLTPDGRGLIYTANRNGRRQLYRMRFDQKDATPIHGTEGGYGPFVSRDGKQVGFYVAGKLRRVGLDGGEPVTLYDDASDPVSATWAADGTLVFARRLLEGLSWIPPAQSVRPLTSLRDEAAERAHLWPHFLPGDEHVVMTVWRGGSIRGCDLELLHVASGDRRKLIEGGSDARYLPDGRLLFARAGTLLQVDFDLESLQVVGQPTVIAEDLVTHPVSGAAHYAVADNGTIVYVARDAFAAGRVLQRIEPNGRIETLAGGRRLISTPRLSPDGTRLAASFIGRGMQVWLIDLDRGGVERVTDDGFNFMPAWTRDSQNLAFSSDRDGPFNLYTKPARSDAPTRRLTESPNMQFAGSWSPDGRWLAYGEFHPETRWDVWLLPVRAAGSTQETPQAPVPFLVTQFDEFRPMFSPDGRMLAYTSNESGRWDKSGRWEVYVRLVDDSEVRVQVSTEGGTDPRWSVDGTHLLYRRETQLLQTEVTTTPTLRVGATEVLHDGLELTNSTETVPTYDVDLNGHIFAVGLGEPLQPTALTVLLGTHP